MQFRRVGILWFVVAAAVMGHAASAMGQPPTPRVLYVSYAGGFAHDSRGHAGDVIEDLGHVSGAFNTMKLADISLLTPSMLNSFDAVVFFTTSLQSSDPPITPEMKAALLQFISNGKGFVGVHSATDTFYNWPEYGQMIGGYFDGHPWTEGTNATIKVEDQTHRSTKHLGASFAFTDEYYQFRNWSRSDVHVLLSLDTAPPLPQAGTRPDNDYALAWTRNYGAGRVFYTALGHATETWDDPRFRTHVLEGIRYAIGGADADGDGLPTEWETRFGLDPLSAAGPSGATGDPDADGVTNAQEFAANTHPNGTHKRYLAEGATGTFFDTRIALVNPSPTLVAHSQLRFLTEGGTVITTDLTLPPRSRHTVFVDDVPGMVSQSFSSLVDSDHEVIVDRTMTWANGEAYGSHAETSVAGPATQWYFAEGATHFRFDLFYLIQNPSTTQTAQVTASYLPAFGPPIDRVYDVPPNSRFTIQVDAIPGLDAADVAAAFTVTNGVPVIVERAMYLTRPGQIWAGGHASAGATALATRWFLAEGASSSTFFDTFVLVGNPNPVDATIRNSYLRSNGTVVVREHTVPAHSRVTFNFKTEAPELANDSAATIVESTNDVPVVVERAMWWPGPTGLDWHEGHGSLGTTQTGVTWALADGEAGGAHNTRTYVLIANTSGPPVDSLRLTVFVEGGTAQERVYPNILRRNQRLSFDMQQEFPDVVGKRFGVMIEALGAEFSGGASTPVTPMQLVVERAMYSDANGVFWAAGSDVVATRVQ